MKKLFIALAAMVLMASCAEEKTVELNGRPLTVEPYGWIDEDELKNDSVQYKLSKGNIVWSVVLCETIFAPILLTGCELYEPVGVKTQYQTKQP